jgi:hypothetical protein
MSHKATRGVCIGVDRHLVAGDVVPPSVDPATLRFLLSIKAVAEIKEEAQESQPTPELTDESSEDSAAESTSEARKRAKKEK